MASTVITPIANRIVTELAALGVSPSVKGYRWAPHDLDALPAGVVELPRVRRRGTDEPERQLGSNDWFLDFPVVLYFDLSEAQFSQDQAVDTVEAFIKAVDANPTLTATVEDAVVSEVEPSIVDDKNRPLVAFECLVAVELRV